MRALTLKPHWAHAIAHMGKRIENRSWAPHKGMIGQRIAIHAGATLPKTWSADILEAAPTLVKVEESEIQTRAIVATCVIGWAMRHLPTARHPWADPSSDWWWTLRDVVVLPVPVPVQRGRLGLWHMTDEQEAAVIAAGGAE